MFIRYVSLLGAALLMAGCSSMSQVSSQDVTQPKNPDNLCSILEEKPTWSKALNDVYNKHGVQPHIVMAIIYQESSFRFDARPIAKKRRGLFGTSFASSAYGFSQALDLTWADYKLKANSPNANRESFSDSVDFIGWYSTRSLQENGIKLDDAGSQYLAYHEGWGGFRTGTHKSKKWLINASQEVNTRSQRYALQMKHCSQSLANVSFFRRYFL